MRSVALVVIVVIAMMIAVVIMIAVVTVPMAVMPAEIDHDCRFTVAVAVPPMATDLDDTAVAFTPAPGTAFAGTAKTTPRASADSPTKLAFIIGSSWKILQPQSGRKVAQEVNEYDESDFACPWLLTARCITFRVPR